MPFGFAFPAARGLLCAVGLLVVMGCAHPGRGPSTAASATTGVRLCAKHRLALITVDGYRRVIFFPDMGSDHWAVDVDEVQARCPNAVPNEQYLTDPHCGPVSGPLGDSFARTRIIYCSQCEREAQRIYRFNRLNRMPIVRLPKSSGGRFTVRPDPW